MITIGGEIEFSPLVKWEPRIYMQADFSTRYYSRNVEAVAQKKRFIAEAEGWLKENCGEIHKEWYLHLGQGRIFIKDQKKAMLFKLIFSDHPGA